VGSCSGMGERAGEDAEVVADVSGEEARDGSFALIVLCRRCAAI
jgi:hypothetical protein